MVSRERVEGIVRTALVTHHAKHGVMLPQVDDFLRCIGDAYDEFAHVLEAVEASRRFSEAKESVESAFEGSSERRG